MYVYLLYDQVLCVCVSAFADGWSPPEDYIIILWYMSVCKYTKNVTRKAPNSAHTEVSFQILL